MDRGQTDENLALIDELLALQKKFMQNAGKVSLIQQSNGGMRTLTFVVQIPDTVPKPPIKPKKRKSPSQKKREMERKKAWIERRNSPSENQADNSDQKQPSKSVLPPTTNAPSLTKMDTQEDITLGVHSNLFVKDKAPSLTKMGTQEESTLGVHSKDYAGDIPLSLSRTETHGDTTLGVNSKDAVGDTPTPRDTRKNTLLKSLDSHGTEFEDENVTIETSPCGNYVRIIKPMERNTHRNTPQKPLDKLLTKFEDKHVTIVKRSPCGNYRYGRIIEPKI